MDIALLKVMKDIKRVFDPNNILNPGKIFGLETKCIIGDNSTTPLKTSKLYIKPEFDGMHLGIRGKWFFARSTIKAGKLCVEVSEMRASPQPEILLQRNRRLPGNRICLPVPRR